MAENTAGLGSQICNIAAELRQKHDALVYPPLTGASTLVHSEPGTTEISERGVSAPRRIAATGYQCCLLPPAAACSASRSTLNAPPRFDSHHNLVGVYVHLC